MISHLICARLNSTTLSLDLTVPFATLDYQYHIAYATELAYVLVIALN